VVINGDNNKQLVTASKLQGQLGYSGIKTGGATTVLSIMYATICYKKYKIK